MKTYKYSIYCPGGNDTALVEAMVLEPKLKRLINDKVMASNPNVEQVGFVDIEKYQLEMAGGEFCGNATRSSAFRFLAGKKGNLKLKVSGVNGLLKAGVDINGKPWAEMPIYKDPAGISYKQNYAVVELEGITQIVVSRLKKFANKSAAKRQALQILKKLKLIDNSPAAGVIFTTRKRGALEIEPVVWVRNIDTIFYETACASGTCAVGLVESSRKNKTIINLPIKQPSGEKISVSVEFKKGRFESAIIKGKIQIVKRDLEIQV